MQAYLLQNGLFGKASGLFVLLAEAQTLGLFEVLFKRVDLSIGFH